MNQLFTWLLWHSFSPSSSQYRSGDMTAIVVPQETTHKKGNTEIKKWFSSENNLTIEIRFFLTQVVFESLVVCYFNIDRVFHTIFLFLFKWKVYRFGLI